MPGRVCFRLKASHLALARFFGLPALARAARLLGRPALALRAGFLFFLTATAVSFQGSVGRVLPRHIAHGTLLQERRGVLRARARARRPARGCDGLVAPVALERRDALLDRVTSTRAPAAAG